MIDAQSDDGSFRLWRRDMRECDRGDDPDPTVVYDSEPRPGWGDAGVIIPWLMYVLYADRRLLEHSYEPMKRWVDAVEARAPELIWSPSEHHGFGDWLALETGTPLPLIATAYFARSTRIVADSAQALGSARDERRYRSLARAISANFVKAFVDGDGSVCCDTQTAYALALSFDLVPKELRAAAGGRLANLVGKTGHIATGILGTAHVLDALSDTGHTDIAYELLLSDSYPSFGHQLRMGATSFWERLDALDSEGRYFADPTGNSFNQPALASVAGWLHRVVGGLRADARSPGFRSFAVAPVPGGGVNWSRIRYQGPHGLIEIAWSVESGDLAISVRVPPGSSAHVVIPQGYQLASTDTHLDPGSHELRLTRSRTEQPFV